MKKIMVYMNPAKKFLDNWETLARLQIDNSFALGWKKEDLLFFTNFKYSYNGVVATVLPDDSFCDVKQSSSKTTTIVNLFKEGLIEKDTLYWAHDLDGYQLAEIKESEIDIGEKAIALTDYGRMPRLSMGSVFFNHKVEKIYTTVKEMIYDRGIAEETALNSLYVNKRKVLIDNMKKLNITYNFQRFNLRSCYKIVDKPIRNVHFKIAQDKLDFFMYGKNKLDMVLLPERLIKLFHYHGIK